MNEESRQAPKVGLGLPVYNGERYVAQAIEAILSQTHHNIELIISDNASTDGTEAICRGYVARDARVRYVRQSENIGASPNFNRTIELAAGCQYFKWAAHDDWIAPDYVERCVQALEADPGAVLAQSLVTNVDAEGKPASTYKHTEVSVDSDRPSARLWARLAHRPCMEVFGLIRMNALLTSGRIRSQLDGDRPLLVELSLLGRFLFIEDELFFHRDHDERFSRRLCGRFLPKDELAWYTTEVSQRTAWRTWMLYGEYRRVIGKQVADPKERWRCYRVLAKALVSRRANLIDMALEPFVTMSPRLFRAVLDLKLKHRGRIREMRAKAAATGPAAQAD